MGVLGQSRDQGADAVVPTANGPVDQTGFFENVGAGFSQAVAGPHSTRVGEAIYQKRSYDDIIKALQAEGEQGQDTLTITTTPTQVKRPFRNPYVSGPAENLLNPSYNPLTSLYGGGDRGEIDQIWGAVQRVRQRKPDFLKAFPDEAALQALTIKRRQQDQQAAQAVTSRATTGGSIGGFIGGMAGSVASLDPENVVGGGFGTAAGKTIARTVIKRAVESAGANAAAAMMGVPGQEADAQRLGQEFTTQDAVHQVEQAAGIGAVFGGAHVIVPKVVGKAGEAVSSAADKVASIPPVRDALVAASIRAGTVQDHSLLGEWTRAHNPGGVIDTSSPDERAAAHTIMRDVATRETSPLHPEHVGPNDARLDAVAHSLGVDLSVPEVPSPAPLQTPTVRDRVAGGRKPATYDEAVHQSEGTGKNPDSSADGHFQFTQGTWLEYAPKVADTKGMSKAQILALRHDRPTAEKAMQAFTADNAKYLRDRGLEDSPGNLSLAHFLGKSDAAKVLNADPATPIERVVDPASFKANRKVLEGKSASEVIAWAHKRIGASVDAPVSRADAVGEADPLDPADYSDVPYERATFKPDELPSATPKTHIEGEQWNPIQSGELLLWERENGGRVIVDGNKRAAMAQRLYADDPSIRLPAAILREADGVSEQMAQAVGMLKNVNLGNGSLEERATALADMPEVTDLLRAPEHQLAVAAIAQLPYQQFGEVLNGRADPLAAARAASSERTHKLADQIRDYWSFQKEHGHRREPVQVVTSPEGAIRTWAASRSQGAVDHNEGDTITRLKPDDHVTLDALLERRNAEADATGNGAGRQPREPSGEAGGRDAAAASDEVLARSNGPGLYDHAVAARDAAEPFSDPVGDGAKRQTELLEHDLRMEVEAYHGGRGFEGGFDLSQAGSSGIGSADQRAVWFTPDRSEAGRYAWNAAPAQTYHGKAVYPAKIDTSDFVRVLPMKYDERAFSDIVAKARDEGRPGVIFEAVSEDARPGVDQIAVLDMSVIRQGDAKKIITAAAEAARKADRGASQSDGGNGDVSIQDGLSQTTPPPALFDLPETGYRLSEEGDKPKPLAEIMREAEADTLAAQALRDCLK